MRALVLALALAPAVLGAQTFAVGSRVRVTAGVYARTDTLGLGTKVLRVAGEKGTITGGPAGSTTVYGVSWFVHYDTPPDGWSTAKYLALDSVVVPPPPPPPPAQVATTVTINQAVVELVGQRTPLFAVVRDQFGMVMPARITWTSLRPAIATVDTSGVVLGVGPGIDTVTAAAGSARAQTLVTIFAPEPPPPPPGPTAVPLLLLVPSSLMPLPGWTHPFYAIVRDSSGAITAGAHATWTVADTTVLTVDTSGLATFLAPGFTTLTATVGSLHATAQVDVRPAGSPVRVNFFGAMQTVFPGPHLYLLADSLGRRAARAFVNIVVP